MKVKEKILQIMAFHQGKKLKAAIKGSPYETIGRAAVIMGMTRQALSHYFREPILPEKFLQKVKEKLQIEIDVKVVDELDEAEIARTGAGLSLEEKYELMMYAVSLYKLPVNKLQEMLEQETDQIKRYGILDAIEFRERIDSLKDTVKKNDEEIQRLRNELKPPLPPTDITTLIHHNP